MPTLALVVKIAERCNLSCDYCYMYEGLDDTWRARPRFLSQADTSTLVARVEEYLSQAADNDVAVELHGGEPLLLGRTRMRALAKELRQCAHQERLSISLQTNGVLFDSEWFDLFDEYDISYSISCDGDRELHDRHRHTRGGGDSAEQVHAALRLSQVLDPRGRLFGGVLAVADLDTEPARVLDFFHDLGVRSVDLLLPDATRGAVDAATVKRAERYLVSAFEHWVKLDDPNFTVRYLREFVLGVLGRRSALDALGGDLRGLLVVESDGSLQLLDVLRVCSREAAWTGMHLRTHSFAEFVETAARAVPPVSAICTGCHAFTACGGGYLPHRFDGESYQNPSAYCSALLGLHQRISSELATVLSQARLARVPQHS